MNSREFADDAQPKNGSRALTVAYYLPQFHAIPENDSWWGSGFTEWRNVDRARPQYLGHDHPRRPDTLGKYDLSNVDIMHRQAELARNHDVDAFCFYFYWFDGHRLLEGPLNNYVKSGPSFPFCLSWANENWTRRWDGKESEVLIGQNYSISTADEVFKSFVPYFEDRRYLRLGDALVLLIHRIDHVPEASAMISRWRQLARERGLGELHIIASETTPGIHPATYGADASAEFPPVGSNTLRSAKLIPVARLRKDFSGRIMSYKAMANRFMRRKRVGYVRYRGVAPGWDNTARRGAKATIYVGHNPELYGRWLDHARKDEESREDGNGIVFINAWNEWAEGAYLEPDLTWGDAFLKATLRSRTPQEPPSSPPAGMPSLAWMRSILLAALGSALSISRRVRGSLQSISGR